MPDPLPDNIKVTVDTLLKCGDAELQWLQMGMSLMVKSLMVKITDDWLAGEPSDIVGWITKTDGNITRYSREDLAKVLLSWHKSMGDYVARSEQLKREGK